MPSDSQVVGLDAPVAVSKAGFWARAKDWVERGKVLQWLIAAVIGVGAALFATYQHFAKAAELQAVKSEQLAQVDRLNCELRAMSGLQVRMETAAVEIRAALRALKDVDEKGRLPRNSLVDSVTGMERALLGISEERAKLGARPC